MVPSWTETLLYSGADVVGRTRFCIHPAERVREIEVVGGTKNIDWRKVEALKGDLLILDREENPREMSEQSPIPVLSTHVTSLNSVAGEIEKIARALASGGAAGASGKLVAMAGEWREIERKPAIELGQWSELSGVGEWLKSPTIPPSSAEVVYVIWKDPWMAASRDTFIASGLEKLGIAQKQLFKGVDNSKYPEFNPGQLGADTVYLFSSEPYPFHKKKSDLKDLIAAANGAAVIDGEALSWFGLRSLRFLSRSLFTKPAK